MAAFTSIAAAVGIAGTAISTVASFAQASKQNKLRRQAEADAEKAMADARKKLEVNYYKGLSIPKEPYELEKEATLAAGAQATQAGVESERGAAATAGRVQAAINEQLGQQRSAMAKDIMGLEMATAEEQSRLRDVGTQIDLAEAEGAQQAAADAQQAAAAATTQGFQGLTSVGQQIMQAAPLYGKSQNTRLTNQIESTATGTGKGQLGLSQSDMQKSIGSMGVVNNVDLSKVGTMSPNEYNTFMAGLDVGTLRQIKSKFPSFASSFNPNPFKVY